ncbi:NAD(P)H-binding protein [Longimicrobium sp.]|uniref:NAD(P)H-binding protein n=1 Tax=Longimicrobium sp. TaxID=2029185 RepID=UPI002E345821|nr:NAD(P)H-binding protein [Longimicrobium sp.]HEX6037067.1 NAD(P)H-binding protein [Longimicrobium sp.]
MGDANGTTLVIGGTGKTGRRVVERLAARGEPVRVGSRAGTPPFDWEDRATWAPALHGMSRVYVTYQPDLAVPGAAETVGELARLAARSDVRRLVLLSGRGEEGAQRAEEAVKQAGVEWTVLRASWFAQNFSENFLLDAVLAGEVVLPADGVREPFVDADDIADAAVAALTEDGHTGRIYELTGPRALTFAEAVDEIARATGRPLRYVPIPAEAFIAGMRADGVPEDVVWLMNELFTQVLDGRNEAVADGVQRALGRPPRDFGDYARATASAGAWDAHG